MTENKDLKKKMRQDENKWRKSEGERRGQNETEYEARNCRRRGRMEEEEVKEEEEEGKLQ